MAEMVYINKDVFINELEKLCGPGVTAPDDMINIDDAEQAFSKLAQPVTNVAKYTYPVTDWINHTIAMLNMLDGKVITFDKAEFREYLCEIRERVTGLHKELTGEAYPRRRDI